MHKHDHRKEVNDQQHSPALRSPQSTPGSPLSFCVTLPSSEHILQNLELLNPETVSFQFSDHFNLHFTTSYLPRICSCSHNYSNTRHLLTQPPTNALAAFQIILNFNIASDYMSHLLERRPSTKPGKAPRGRARARLAANGGAPKSFATVASSASVLPQKLQVTSVTTIQRLSDS